MYFVLCYNLFVLRVPFLLYLNVFVLNNGLYIVISYLDKTLVKKIAWNSFMLCVFFILHFSVFWFTKLFPSGAYSSQGKAEGGVWEDKGVLWTALQGQASREWAHWIQRIWWELDRMKNIHTFFLTDRRLLIISSKEFKLGGENKQVTMQCT